MLLGMKAENIGHMSKLSVTFTRQMNLITGANGLGKSFLLELCWWALTHTWTKHLIKEGEEVKITHSPRTLHNSSLVIYAREDGGFSIFDPLKEKPLHFRPEDILNGVRKDGQMLCKGLIEDVSLWQLSSDPKLRDLYEILMTLSPPGCPLRVGDLKRVSLMDVRETPAIRMPYGDEDVPVTYLPESIKRIWYLAYLMLWVKHEHRYIEEKMCVTHQGHMVLLLDGFDRDMHPEWQRTFLKGLSEVLRLSNIEAQIFVTTHSPLVMASMEPWFNKEDSWHHFSLISGKVMLKKQAYIHHGEIGNWLTDEAFGLREPRSLEGEQAVLAALEIMRKETPDVAEILSADQKLRKAGLPDIDTFWVQWGYFKEQKISKLSRGNLR